MVRKAVSKIEQVGNKANKTTENTSEIDLDNKKDKFLLKWKQIKYIPKFLSPIEKKVIQIAGLIIIICLGLISYLFIKNNVITKPATGGSYTEIIVGTPQYINPIYAPANEADRDLTKLIFAGLLKYNTEHKLIGDLAKEWFLNEDKKTYTFILRDDVYWPDGKQFTSEDVVYTIQAIQNEVYESPLYNRWAGIKVTGVDDFTIQFELPEPYNAFLENTTLGILPAHLWNNILPENAKLAELNIKPIGLGAYSFDTFIKDKQGYIKSYNLVSNKNYHLGTPYIDKITFKFFPTFELAVDNLKQHNADGLNFLPLNLKEFLSTRNDLNYYSLSLPQYTALFFNTENNNLLQNKDIRQALSLLINKEIIVKQVLDGEATVINSPILPGMLGYERTTDNQENNIEQAKEILAKAGWKYPVESNNKNIENTDQNNTGNNDDGSNNEEATTTPEKNVEASTDDKTKYLIKDDKEFIINLTLSNQPQAVAVAEMIQKMWLVAGIKTNLKIVEANQIQKEIIAPRDFEILLFGEILDSSGDLYPFWHSSQITETGLNLTNFKNEAADKLLTDIRTEEDKNVKIELIQKFEKTIIDNIPAIFLYNPNYTYVMSEKIKGMDNKRIVVPDDRLNGIEQWYIKIKKGLK